MLATAGRSGGVTTAITHDVRAGTSTCERVLRISSSAIAISERRRKRDQHQADIRLDVREKLNGAYRSADHPSAL
jgi:hypothetical protein